MGKFKNFMSEGTTGFESGKWIQQQTGKDMITYAVLLEKQKNGSWSVIKIDNVYKKAVKSSTTNWYPEPKLIDSSDVPEKLKNKVLSKL